MVRRRRSWPPAQLLGAACPAASSGETPPAACPAACPALRPALPLLRPDAYIFTVDVEEISSSRPLGMKVGVDKSVGLVVQEVREFGAIYRCSVIFPLDAVRCNDVILCANGVHGDPQDIVAAMRTPGDMLLVITR